MLYSAYKLNKQGDNIQPWWTPFPIWHQSVVPCPVLTVASWPAYRFLKRQVRWFDFPISFRIFHYFVIHTVKGFGVVNKAEIDVFLELSCFFDDPADVGNLICGSSALSKTSLNIWKFMAHILLIYIYNLDWGSEGTQSCPTLCDPMDYSLPVSSVRGQEYWSGLPFPSPVDLPNPGMEPGSPTFQANALPSEPPQKLYNLIRWQLLSLQKSRIK